ncbi:thiosulfate dehydrogenase [quinone] large subunit [Dyadobacter sp. BE34]|uniref:Thiosulfate dehydrogenase [quinone] large subunit n=1 Tax=Dyadobacter fermentans TaxID=94254 RepID=A0ABU1QUZ0_9BACT|nr:MULTISPECIES: DoxX family membrane protein [Dyadobacter]MDR6804812.1 thiosulfate dehydrogenase [quinone] large subunit [Dyadobacter fermentans]MDR7043429.1 thiosulfate dehydrogenase [quinone] large subunit [Dyadobacter sp. BE242]MDR7197741.1 thiosulfate dehydrogenase [quinone] large subunit [Dyadobacter sp. BE34]MDR7214826.1 thiosulfate dehydrogenase [quinone] large subunit [Dyadobacter sp. BE31]MDR7262361.1 thiosulfate dehydrogenase [quinone] large subunit [Dyadobacter sp. BE32]
MNAIVFLLLRLGIGISMFGHGLVRLPKLNAFSQWMVGSFAKSMLPAELVRPFSMVLPFAELVIGFLLLIGLFTEPALISGAILVLLLLFGTSMVENWEAIPSQLIHLIFFAVLLQFIASNSWSLDKILNRP